MDLSCARANRTLVVSPSSVVRFGICGAVESAPSWNATTAPTLESAELAEADLVILDILRRDEFVAAAGVARRRFAGTPLVGIATGRSSAREEFESALAADVTTVVSIYDTIREIHQALGSARSGAGWLSPTLGAKALINEDSHPERPMESGIRRVSLTKSELQVLPLIAHGHSDRQIAEKTYRSERAVKYHVANLVDKLCAENRANLVYLAVGAGLLEPPCPFGKDERCPKDKGTQGSKCV